MFFVLGSISQSILAQAPIAGYVLEMEGAWYMTTNGKPEKLSRYDDVPAAAVIHVRSPNEIDRIAILSRDGVSLAARQCSRAGECDQPITIPRNVVSIQLPSVIDTAIQVLKKDPGLPSKHLSRGSEEFADSVVPLVNGKIDFAPVIRKASEGAYILRLRPITYAGRFTTGAALEPIPFYWSPGGTSDIRVKDVRPGLYQLNLLKKNRDQYETIPGVIWIFVSDPDSFDKAAVSFYELTALARSWGNDVEQATVHTVLRAHLAALAAAK